MADPGFTYGGTTVKGTIESGPPHQSHQRFVKRRLIWGNGLSQIVEQTPFGPRPILIQMIVHDEWPAALDLASHFETLEGLIVADDTPQDLQIVAAWEQTFQSVTCDSITRIMPILPAVGSGITGYWTRAIFQFTQLEPGHS